MLWHDYETFGIDSAQDFPAQFAYLRTDFDLNVLGEGGSIYCQPPADYLPDPGACLLTGISPQYALQHGLAEPDFADTVYRLLQTPKTVSVGYNSMRFDEEFTRQLLWRNFFPVYEREYQNDNARFDLIDVLRMAYALRPDGIEWPSVDGKPSFKLENLAKANGLLHSQAHDALSDVQATVALAQRLKRAQPKLWKHAFALRKKSEVQPFIDIKNRQPVVHVSQRFPAERGCTAIWQPICQHPHKSNEWIGVDLAFDVDALLTLDAEAIAERIFIRQADLPEGEARIAIKTLHSNRAPMLAPLSVLKDLDLARIQLDLEGAMRRAAQLQNSVGLTTKLQQVFALQDQQREQAKAQHDLQTRISEPQLYAGFSGPRDQALCKQIRSADPQQLQSFSDQLQDARLVELLRRYRARWFPETLSVEEQGQWHKRVCDRLQFAAPITHAVYQQKLAEHSEQAYQAGKHALLDQLRAYGVSLAQTWS
jgi:exodeoxyribonuclease I